MTALSASGVPYIGKPNTVAEFGCDSLTQLDRWRPQICGVCCLKSVGDAKGLTTDTSLWELTERCIKSGAFIETKTGVIEGIFYKPLLKVAVQLGLKGTVYRWLPLFRLRRVLAAHKTPVLSIDLAKVSPKYTGTHLITIVSYDRYKKQYVIHDSASILGAPGAFVYINSKALKAYSNRRGFSLW